MLRPMNTFTRIRRNARRKYIEDYAYAPDFVAKLQDELGDRATALRALEGLDAWFIACLYADNRMIGMPSKTVDIAWHEFILRTREYHRFCERAFGEYLHHTPDSTMKVAAASLLPATLEIVERHAIPMVLFTADEDSGSLTIQFTEVARAGNGTSQHGLYVTADQNAHANTVFRLEHSWIHDMNGGNAVKSRAARNEIEFVPSGIPTTVTAKS